MNKRLFGCLLMLTVAGSIVATSALAQLRTLPQNAKFARTGDAQPLPFVKLNGKIVKLAPGGVIYNENNRSIVHSALPPGARVAFTLDLSGDIGRIYILTAQEQAKAGSK